MNKQIIYIIDKIKSTIAHTYDKKEAENAETAFSKTIKKTSAVTAAAVDAVCIRTGSACWPVSQTE